MFELAFREKPSYTDNSASYQIFWQYSVKDSYISAALKLKQHLLQFVESALRSGQSSAEIPSAIALVRHYDCSYWDVTTALNELEQQGYGFQNSHRSEPILIWDNLIK